MTKIKVSDYVMEFMVSHGMRDVFMVSGGGIMHLQDSLGRRSDMHYYCNYHEQACAIAAEGHARVTGGVGACLVTIGPGGVNAISGLAGAWHDSVPVFVLSGQVRRDLIADYATLRQVGPQEGDVISMVRPITKYAVTLLQPSLLRYELEKAYYLATTGRPGPVWIEIPLDVQGAEVELETLAGFEPPIPAANSGTRELPSVVARVAELLRNAKRPLLMLGNGIHRAKAESVVAELLARHQLPAVVPYSGKDLIPEDHPMNMGVFGSVGQRRANFALQNCDLLLALSVGLNVSKTGFNFAGFAPRATKVVVDIDAGQLYHQPLRPDLPIQADVGEFLRALLAATANESIKPSEPWLTACAEWRERYPIVEDDSVPPEFVNGYSFMNTLGRILDSRHVVVTGNGFDAPMCYQAFRVTAGQRVLINGNWGAMGWDLPTSVGACIGRDKQPVVCVCGDGSMQWNVHELLTISHNRLPIHIFVFNNNGYSSIRATQDNLFAGLHVGADAASGVANPDFEKLAAAYRLSYDRLDDGDQLEQRMRAVLARQAPLLCEVKIWPKQPLVPKASAFRREDGKLESRPLEDMAPLLPREEVWHNMHRFD